MFRWLRERRRRRILAEPFPPEWEEMLGGVALCKALPQPARERLRDDLRLFMAERHWEGCGGLELTDEIRVTVAAQAAILTLGRSVDAFGHVASVLVYPERFFAPVVEEDEDGVVSEYEDDLEGEAWERGTVILSWSDVRLDARRMDGRNLVLHEFAHQLDLLDFLAAAPRTGETRDTYARWEEVFREAYEAHAARPAKGRRKDPVLDPYGAEDEWEFFAVATEAFFEKAGDLKRHHPELYGVLSEYYDQDPAGWRPQN